LCEKCWKTGVKKGADLAWLLLAVAVASVIFAFSPIWLVDDAYISFRYSHNLAEGRGLVFNEGEYVEGYTNLLWILVMTLPELFGIPIHLFAVYAGICFGFFALVETWRALGFLEVYGWHRGLAVVALAAYPEFWLSITMGLEGGLFAFLLALSVRLLFSGKIEWTGAVGGLMFTTRPESLLLVPVFVLYIVIEANEDRFVRLLRLVAPWLGLVVAVILWRLYYYGAWLPNTIAAKSPPDHNLDMMLANASTGIGYLANFALSAAPLVLGALIAPILAHRNAAVWLCLGAFLAEVFAVLVNGGDWMPHYRLLTVYTPLFAVLLGLALNCLSTRLAAQLGAGLVVVSMVLTLYGWSSPEKKLQAPAVPKPSNSCWGQLSNAVQPALISTDRVSVEQLGIMGYMLDDTYTHDLLGLTDFYAAHYGDKYVPMFGKAAPAHTYYDIQPNVIIGHSPGFGHLAWLAQASGGTYNEKYSTYQLTTIPVCDREGGGTWEMMVSVQNQDVSRVLPALAPLGPERVKVPLNQRQ
jgi:hypothetical protein